jgi:hypothetical protein
MVILSEAQDGWTKKATRSQRFPQSCNVTYKQTCGHGVGHTLYVAQSG